jgi:hypothetical protein
MQGKIVKMQLLKLLYKEWSRSVMFQREGRALKTLFQEEASLREETLL